MNKQLIAASLLFIMATCFSFYTIITHQKHNPTIINNTPTSTMILYYGDTCPHCKIVEEYIKTNKVAEKLFIINKEVYNNQANADELTARAKTCGLDANAIGVPFLWTGQDCLVGDQPIIKFLDSQIANNNSL
jgi:glutaredoxin